MKRLLSFNTFNFIRLFCRTCHPCFCYSFLPHILHKITYCCCILWCFCCCFCCSAQSSTLERDVLTDSPLFGISLIALCTHTHTHTFNGPFSTTTQVSRYQKGKTIVDFTEARDSEWQWHQLGHMQVCTSLQTDNHVSTLPLIM